MPDEAKRPWEQKLEDAGMRAEQELRRVVTYINDEVMPEVRRNSSRALRTASAELEKLARQMEARWAPENGPGDARR